MFVLQLYIIMMCNNMYLCTHIFKMKGKARQQLQLASTHMERNYIFCSQREPSLHNLKVGRSRT
jgi:hypothetical protein